MKQEMSSVDVAALVKELHPRLLDAKITKIYQHSADEIKIGLHIFKEGRTNLVIEAGKRFHLTKNPQTAPKFPQSFPMLLRKHLTGGRITDVSQHDFDRIIVMQIGRGEDKTLLVIELFSKGNIVLLNSGNQIILPLKTISFKDRKVRGGEPYELPQAQISPITATTEQLKEMFAQSDTDIVRTMAAKMNLGGQYAEEICIHAGIDKNIPAKEIKDLSLLQNALQDIFKPLNTELKPQIILKGGLKIDVLPFAISQYEKNEKKYFSTFNEALDEYFAGSVKKDESLKAVKSAKKEIMSTYEYRLQKQTIALSKFREEEQMLVHKGELIYANYRICDEILRVINIAREKGYSWDDIRSILKKSNVSEAKMIKSIDPGKGLIKIILDSEEVELDIRLSVTQNSQIYYDRSKKLSGKIKGALAAIEETKKLTEKKMDIPTRKKIQKQKQKWFEQFRWFFSSDGLLIIGGRDAQSNEDIVKKYMQKQDIFFHAHVSGSPAVVVKSEGKEIPQSTLIEAAQFTVSYSGIWKSGQASGDAYWVLPEQISKTPESGEYVAKGAFVIRGKRNYFKDIILGAAIGIEMGDEKKLIGGPVSAIRKTAGIVIEVEPGEFNQNDISKKIYRLLNEMIEDKKLIKTIASPDRIAMFLPPGGSRVKE